MQNKIIVYLLLVAILVVVISLVALLWNDGFSFVKTFKTAGRVIFHKTELVPREIITEFIVFEGRIYIFYEDTGMVNVYTLEGHFVQGIQVCTSKNSHGAMAIADGLLILKAKRPVIYVFDPSTLHLEYYVTGYHSEHKNMTESYKQYEKLSQHFSEAQSHSYEEYRYILSDSQRELLVSKSGGRFETVNFLPRRNSCVDDLCVVLVVLIVGLCEFIRKTARA